MERDFIHKYARDKPPLETSFRDIYNDVVADIITEVRQAEGLRFEEDDRFLRMIAVEAIQYAREFTRDRASPIFEARRSRARGRLQDALASWLHDRERKAAADEAARQAALNAPRRKRRNAAKGKKK